MKHPDRTRDSRSTRASSTWLAGLMATVMALAAGAQDASTAPPEGSFERWHGYTEETHTTESGLQYKILRLGDGPRPESRKSRVTVLYRGFLADGRQFDTTYEWGQPVETQLRKTIDGWEEGLQLMPVGSKFAFLIPPDLAYGKKSRDRIPSNAWLMFEVELLDVKN